MYIVEIRVKVKVFNKSQLYSPQPWWCRSFIWSPQLFYWVPSWEKPARQYPDWKGRTRHRKTYGQAKERLARRNRQWRVKFPRRTNEWRSYWIVIRSNLKHLSKWPLKTLCLRPRVRPSDLTSKKKRLIHAWKHSFSINKIEVETNTFAVELLLPDSKVKEYNHTSLSMEEIAGINGIPKKVVRLKTYNFFGV